jgi:hypothetical protein
MWARHQLSAPNLTHPSEFFTPKWLFFVFLFETPRVGGHLKAEQANT